VNHDSRLAKEERGGSRKTSKILDFFPKNPNKKKNPNKISKSLTLIDVGTYLPRITVCARWRMTVVVGHDPCLHGSGLLRSKHAPFAWVRPSPPNEGVPPHAHGHPNLANTDALCDRSCRCGRSGTPPHHSLGPAHHANLQLIDA
jgi:hypothetical protein